MGPGDLIDLCDSSDDEQPVARPRKRPYLPAKNDDCSDIVLLDSPPAHMRRWSNSKAPIDVEADEEAGLEIYTSSERKRRRALMLEEDPDAPFYKPNSRKRSISDGEDSEKEVEQRQARAGPSTRAAAEQKSVREEASDHTTGNPTRLDGSQLYTSKAPGRADDAPGPSSRAVARRLRRDSPKTDFLEPDPFVEDRRQRNIPDGRDNNAHPQVDTFPQAGAPPVPGRRYHAGHVAPRRLASHPVRASRGRQRNPAGRSHQTNHLRRGPPGPEEHIARPTDRQPSLEQIKMNYDVMEDVLAEPDVQAAILAPVVLSDAADPADPVPRKIDNADIDALVSQLVELLPDICPIYAGDQLTRSASRSNPIQVVITKALDEGYPKRKSQAEKKEAGDDSGYLGKTYRAEKRIGRWYRLNCETALEEAFSAVPIAHIREVMIQEASLFGPSYLHLLRNNTAQIKPFIPMKRARPPSKGKGAAPPELDAGVIEFEREKNWVLAYLANERLSNEAKAAKNLADQIAIDNGEGVECGCCFGDYMMDNMFQCCDGHLFCRECCTRHAETKLGDQSHSILCMDTSGCQLAFSELELGRFLPTKSMELYYRLRLAQELEDAAIEGLETCPSCPWAVVIDNPDEKLFRCLNEACAKVSCRSCRKSEHLPLSCEEYVTELKKDKRHAVEDAMSDALIRKCPSCRKPYIKETGCNKIMCIKCGKYSCYICQKAISGYEHFDQVSERPRMPGNSKVGKCRLWDPEEAAKDVQTVVAARDAAVAALREQAQAEGFDIEAADLAVDAPIAPLGRHDAHLAMAAELQMLHPEADAQQEPAAHLAVLRGEYPPHIMGPLDAHLYAVQQEHLELFQRARLAPFRRGLDLARPPAAAEGLLGRLARANGDRNEGFPEVEALMLRVEQRQREREAPAVVGDNVPVPHAAGGVHGLPDDVFWVWLDEQRQILDEPAVADLADEGGNRARAREVALLEMQGVEDYLRNNRE